MIWTETVKKPDPEIFRRALGALKIRPEEAVFVGDNPESDIAGAKAVGMKTIWMRDSFWPEPRNADAMIGQLCDLPEVLNSMR